METTKQEVELVDLQKFTEMFALRIVKIGVECSKCEKYFNIHLNGGERSLVDIEPHKMICGDCKKIETAKRRQQLLSELGY